MNRILIAEDEARLAAFIEKGLQKSGFSTAVAEDGEKALMMAATGDYKILLLDVGLPVKDGWAVLKEIRQQDKAFPVIIVTALNDASQSIAFQLGANDYVKKPFRFNELLAKVKSLLNSPQ
jgi:two-component system, OmpR family, copper resistance phosphate regulon response regulator CusR